MLAISKQRDFTAISDRLGQLTQIPLRRNEELSDIIDIIDSVIGSIGGQHGHTRTENAFINNQADTVGGVLGKRQKQIRHRDFQ